MEGARGAAATHGWTVLKKEADRAAVLPGRRMRVWNSLVVGVLVGLLGLFLFITILMNKEVL